MQERIQILLVTWVIRRPIDFCLYVQASLVHFLQ